MNEGEGVNKNTMFLLKNQEFTFDVELSSLYVWFTFTRCPYDPCSVERSCFCDDLSRMLRLFRVSTFSPPHTPHSYAHTITHMRTRTRIRTLTLTRKHDLACAGLVGSTPLSTLLRAQALWVQQTPLSTLLRAQALWVQRRSLLCWHG